MSENCCHGGCCCHKHGFNSMKCRLWVLIVAAVLCIVSYFWDDILGDAYEIGKYFNPAWLVVLVCGGQLIVDGFKELFKEKRVGTSLLISVAIFACIALEILCWCGVALDGHSGGHDHSYLFSAAEVAFIMWFGELLEDFAVAKLTKKQATNNHDHGHSHAGEGKKTRIERTVDKWAGIIVPSAVVIAVVVFVLVLTVFKEDWHVALTRAMTVLVVFCPCSLVLSTPTAIVAGLRNASSKNIVIKKQGDFPIIAKKISKVNSFSRHNAISVEDRKSLRKVVSKQKEASGKKDKSNNSRLLNQSSLNKEILNKENRKIASLLDTISKKKDNIKVIRPLNGYLTKKNRDKISLSTKISLCIYELT